MMPIETAEERLLSLSALCLCVDHIFVLNLNIHYHNIFKRVVFVFVLQKNSMSQVRKTTI